MWWLYFATSSEEATRAITRSDDPGRIGASFHYVHAILIAGISATAIGNDLVMAHPRDGVSRAASLALTLGPILYLLGGAIYKKVVRGGLPISHVAGALVLAGWLTSAVMLGVGLWERRDGGDAELTWF